MSQRKKKQNPLVFKSTRPKLDLPSYVTTLVNPFDDSAKGTKIHDENASKTFTFQCRQFVDMEVNNVGMSYFQLYPNIHEFYNQVGMNDTDLPTTGIISGGSAFTTDDVAEFSDLTSSGVKYRIVSWGFRLVCLEEALNAKGRILVRELDADGAKNSVGTTGVSDNTVNIPITHDMDITVIPNHISTGYKDFMPLTSSYTDVANDAAQEHAWRTVGLTVIGATPSGTANTGAVRFSIEVVYNLELLPKIGSIGMRLSTPPAPHSNQVLEAVHNTRAVVPLVHKTPSLGQQIKKFATRALTSVADYALDRLTGGASHFLESRVLPHLTNVGRRSGLFIKN